MNVRAVFYVRENYKSTEVDQISSLLSNSKLTNEKRIINQGEEQELKLNVLLSLAVSKRIRIKQTQKSKRLYPQLVIFLDNKPITFYPQSRGGKTITIKEFLEGFQKNEIKCIHELPELKLKGKEVKKS